MRALSFISRVSLFNQNISIYHLGFVCECLCVLLCMNFECVCVYLVDWPPCLHIVYHWNRPVLILYACVSGAPGRLDYSSFIFFYAYRVNHDYITWEISQIIKILFECGCASRVGGWWGVASATAIWTGWRGICGSCMESRWARSQCVCVLLSKSVCICVCVQMYCPLLQVCCTMCWALLFAFKIRHWDVVLKIQFTKKKHN